MWTTNSVITTINKNKFSHRLVKSNPEVVETSKKGGLVMFVFCGSLQGCDEKQIAFTIFRQ